MPRRRMLAPINTVKHYVQHENATLSAGQKRTMDIVDALVAPATTAVQSVRDGAVVKAVFIEHWVKSNASAGTDAKFQYVIEKIPSGADTITFTQMNNLASYPNKKNILYFTQGVIGDLTSNSVPIFKTWVLIPKGKQRFGLGDKFVATLAATDAVIQNCGFATYKEFV